MPSDKPIKRRCAALIKGWEAKYGHKVYCTQVAGHGTDHVGEGRCRYHGGCSTGPKKSLKYLETQVAKKYRKQIEIFEKLSEDERWDLESALAVAYICLGRAISERKFYHLVPKLVETIGRTIERLRHWKYGEKITIEIKAMKEVVEVVVLAFNDSNQYDDPEKRREIFASHIQEAITNFEGNPKSGNNGKNRNDGDNDRMIWRLE